MSHAWKRLERDVAKAFGGKRLLRGDNFGRKCADVSINDNRVKIDCKLLKSLKPFYDILLLHEAPVITEDIAGTRVITVDMAGKISLERLEIDPNSIFLKKKRWYHHTLLHEIMKKYCTKDNDIPVLVFSVPACKKKYMSLFI